MLNLKVLSAAIFTAGLAMVATSANAAMTTDHHGNVGYDTYNECAAAVKDGSAKFYTPYTYQNTKRRAGEASVKKMRLSEVMIPQSVVDSKNLATTGYQAGACDLGVGQSNGRYGVSGALVGKYVPIAADMPVNVYMNKQGEPVRLTMQQCDNHFSGSFPTPILHETKAEKAPATSEAPATPEAQVAIEEVRSVEPVIVETKRVIRPTTYRVKEVLVVPQDQFKRVETDKGSVIAIEDANKRTVVIGKEASAEVIDNTEISQTFPVIEIPDNDAVE